MRSDLRARTDPRADATRRRTELTSATALIGLVATAGFGWLAAATYAGAPKPDTTPTTHATSTPTATPSTNRHEESTSDDSSSNRSTDVGSSSSSSGSSSSGITRGTGRAHVSTGSS